MLRQFKDNIYQGLVKCGGLEKDNIELELKFLELKRANYSRVVSRLAKLTDSVVESVTVDFFLKDNRRLTKQTDSDEVRDTTKTSIFTKTLPADESLAESIKLSLSYEKDEVVVDPSIIDCATFRRVKNRKTFYFDRIKVDCSVVDKTSKSNVQTSYEIEIEALEVTTDTLLSYRDNSKCILTIMSDMLEQINSILMEYVVIRTFNKVTDSRQQDRIYTRALSNARDLKKGDITTDGFINGNYVLTVKADGIRTILYIDIYGIWKIQTSRDEDIVQKIADPVDQLKSAYPIFLDCEEVFDEVNEIEMYIPFDVIILKSKEIQKLPLISDDAQQKSRYFYLNKITGALQKKINVSLKPYIYLGKTLESVKMAFKKINEFAERQNYENDGYIASPIKEQYLNPLPSHGRGNSVLSEHAEICKIKPWEKLSIDIVYDPSLDRVFVTNNEGKLVEFHGTDKNKFSVCENLDISDWQATACEVVEVAPRRDPDGTIVLYPYRLRHDKILPNGEKVAKSVWDSLFDHVSVDTVLGTDLKLVRMYHNDIKRYTLSMINSNSPKKRRERLLVDIGSGRLGDLAKWTHAGIDKVLAIEPNEDNIAEAYRRLASSRSDIEVKIINAGGEDSDLITDALGEMIDSETPTSVAITSMLSMSFFFIDDVTFENFCKTLRSIAKQVGNSVWFYFFTIDGDSVRKEFDDESGKRKFDIVEMEYIKSQELLKTHIQGTIVDDYTEGIVDIDRLVNRLTPTGKDPFLVFSNLRDPEDSNLGIPKYFFNENNKKFSSLYSYGAMKIYP